MAEIGWIDFSPTHRARVAALLDALKAEGVVDELGIGTIRDSLADLMFPGLSTIQTRAKYFFIIPYILCDYQNLSNAEKRKHPPNKYLERIEHDVMWELGDKYNHDPRSRSGVIGITKQRPEKIVRRPSEIYWSGLQTFQIIEHKGVGVESFLRLRTQKYASQLAEPYAGDDTPQDDADAEHDDVFRIRIEYDPAWRKNLTLHGMELTRNEANTLAHRFRDAGHNLVLGELMIKPEVRKRFLDSGDFATAAKLTFGSCSRAVQNVLRMAHDFSEVMYGAHMLYNHLLQKAKFGSDAYLHDIHAWHKSLRGQLISYDTYDPHEILRHAPRTKLATQQFITAWWNLVNRPNLDMGNLGHLVTMQERHVKGHKARLILNRLDDVSEERWIGLTQLNYRLAQAKQMISDIESGERNRRA